MTGGTAWSEVLRHAPVAADSELLRSEVEAVGDTLRAAASRDLGPARPSIANELDKLRSYLAPVHALLEADHPLRDRALGNIFKYAVRSKAAREGRRTCREELKALSAQGADDVLRLKEAVRAIMTIVPEVKKLERELTKHHDRFAELYMAGHNRELMPLISTNDYAQTKTAVFLLAQIYLRFKHPIPQLDDGAAIVASGRALKFVCAASHYLELKAERQGGRLSTHTIRQWLRKDFVAWLARHSK
jgi:hypothetical protein